jgi:outer membrane receptor protein involved in Fe transport
VWEPTDWLRFRGTQSRDIRAPALNELYSPGSNVRNAVTIRNNLNPNVTNNPTITQNTSLGNPNLDPEIADTTTFGFVLRPSGMFEGFNVSVDYYRIDLNDAITNLSTANIAGLCNSGNTAFCSFFTYDSAGVATSLTAPALNLGGFISAGYDVAIDYRRDVGPGTVEVNFSGTYVDESTVDTGVGAPVDRGGENGAANFGAVPTFRANFTTTYRTDAWSGSLQAVYTSEGNLDNLYNTAPNLTVTDNSVPAYVVFNLYGSYNLTERVRLFGAIENALDREPVATPYAILNAPVYGAYYDKIGRQFSIGLDVRF